MPVTKYLKWIILTNNIIAYGFYDPTTADGETQVLAYTAFRLIIIFKSENQQVDY